MNWKVVLTKKAAKQLQKLPVYVRSTLLFLVKDLEAHGPATSGLWKNYCKFQGLATRTKGTVTLSKADQPMSAAGK